MQIGSIWKGDMIYYSDRFPEWSACNSQSHTPSLIWSVHHQQRFHTNTCPYKGDIMGNEACLGWACMAICISLIKHSISKLGRMPIPSILDEYILQYIHFQIFRTISQKLLIETGQTVVRHINDIIRKCLILWFIHITCQLLTRIEQFHCMTSKEIKQFHHSVCPVDAIILENDYPVNHCLHRSTVILKQHHLNIIHSPCVTLRMTFDWLPPVGLSRGADQHNQLQICKCIQDWSNPKF